MLVSRGRGLILGMFYSVFSSTFFVRLFMILNTLTMQAKLPDQGYISPFYQISIDTLFSTEDFIRFVPEWNKSELGVDVRYITEGEDNWQSICLIDSIMLKFTEGDSLPVTISLTRLPTHFSISRSSGFALVYQQVNTGDSVRYLNRVDLGTGEVIDFQVENTYNLFSEPCGAIITDDGNVVSFSGELFHFNMGRTNIRQNGVPYTLSSRRDLIDSESENLVLVFDAGGTIVSTSNDTIAHFDTGRTFSYPVLTNSGERVLYSSSNGISSFDALTGDIESTLFSFSGQQAPIISSSDVFWACSFERNAESGNVYESLIVGRVDDVHVNTILYTNKTDLYSGIEVLSVSDQGDVLCTISLKDDRFVTAYRYILFNRFGHIIWLSEVTSPLYSSPQIAGNAATQLMEIRPKLACVSADGRRVVVWYNGVVIEIQSISKDFLPMNW